MSFWDENWDNYVAYYDDEEDDLYLTYHCLECNYIFMSYQEFYMCPNCGSYELDYYDDNVNVTIKATNFEREKTTNIGKFLANK